MKDGGPITVQHGGDGGVESLSLELTGNYFILFLGPRYLLTPSELQKTKNSSLFMVAVSITRVITARESMCPALLSSLFFYKVICSRRSV